MNTLQSLVFPNLEVKLEELMYWRLDARVWTDLRGRSLRFAAGAIASSDTFYNGFTVQAWKRECTLPSLALRLAGAGEFVVRIGLHRAGQTSVWLDEQRCTLDDHAGVLPITAWNELTDGLLFFQLRALGPGRIDAGAFVTSDAPRNDVRLGLVITHFNRQAQVLPAIERIERELLDRPDLAGHLSLTVVDNSRNLPALAHPRVSQLPNRNLGGTGGFVRGLLELVDSGNHTHALFMDDDASCEAESIARCFAFLQYGRDPALSMAGALLRESAPWQLVEKGARFNGRVVPLHEGLDMRSVDHLLDAERGSSTPEYGAWWFFAFPLQAVRQYPFPFFVRGDDVFFGLRNAFRIVTLNGVACLGEDFSAKHGPLTAYLDARYHLLLALFGEQRVLSRIVWVGSRLFVKALTSYQYASARAVTLAVRHTLAGPAFFRDNLDMQAVRSEIAGWSATEKLVPIERRGLTIKGPRRRRESALRRLGRLVTLQGFLLPRFLLMDRTLLQPKGFHGKASDVFRYRRVLYEHAPSGLGYLATFDRGRFFGELGSFLKAFTALLRDLPALHQTYLRAADELGSEAFWRGVYRDDLPARKAGEGDVGVGSAPVEVAAASR